ncbi:hypothetical protein psyc5s11_03080 [Clostridium gelidum]|uniref:Uncharacterized protein n=1 Tax=Clostridium gelidum TaxID=704125 RepID=A0ABM7T005_9CLOT|nr:hypothetical protein psyc5s11_03080 [Clostridium gelidum]
MQNTAYSGMLLILFSKPKFLVDILMINVSSLKMISPHLADNSLIILSRFKSRSKISQISIESSKFKFNSS